MSACGQLLTDRDGTRARCTVERYTEHPHNDLTARAAIAAGLAAPEPWGKEWGRYRLPDGRVVSMQRKSVRVRFIADDGTQVGPEHRNVVPAIVYAAANRWYDLDAPAWLNAGMMAEVQRNTTHRGKP